MEDIENPPVEREALKLILRLLDDVEGSKDFERDLGKLLEGNERARLGVINFLHSAIQILEAEVAILARAFALLGSGKIMDLKSIINKYITLLMCFSKVANIKLMNRVRKRAQWALVGDWVGR